MPQNNPFLPVSHHCSLIVANTTKGFFMADPNLFSMNPWRYFEFFRVVYYNKTKIYYKIPITFS